MKKAYINPAMTTVTIKSQQLLTGSPQLGGNYTGGDVLGRDDEDADWDDEENM